MRRRRRRKRRRRRAPDLRMYLSRWLKSTFMVSWLGSGSSWISFFTVCSLRRGSWISDQRRGRREGGAPGAAAPLLTLTDGLHKLREGAEGEQRLRKLPEEHFEGSGHHVDVLPLAVVQVQGLL